MLLELLLPIIPPTRPNKTPVCILSSAIPCVSKRQADCRRLLDYRSVREANEWRLKGGIGIRSTINKCSFFSPSTSFLITRFYSLDMISRNSEALGKLPVGSLVQATTHTSARVLVTPPPNNPPCNFSYQLRILNHRQLLLVSLGHFCPMALLPSWNRKISQPNTNQCRLIQINFTHLKMELGVPLENDLEKRSLHCLPAVACNV